MRKIFISIMLFFSTIIAISQNPYTQAVFAYDSTMNLTYGTAISYTGQSKTLKLDLYKPIGDNNCKRPVILLLHGGAWVVGSKEDASMKFMAREMAKRGWVAACINYRLGTHKSSDYSMNFLCSTSLSEPCAYNSDTAEAIRANYRAMQDAKGAVRFMKSRHLIDSTDVDNVFMAGESAGAFTSYLVAFLDNENEKPILCGSIGDANSPSSYFNGSNCVETPLNFTRPDLESIHGDIEIGMYDATVRGIGSFFGAVFDLNIFQSNSQNPSCIYMFAQGSDVIVHYDYGKLFGRIDTECFNNFLCKNYEHYPYGYGNEGLKKYFELNPSLNIDFLPDIVYNFNANNNCFSNGHQIDNPQQRLQNMTDYFAIKISESGNNPATNCNNVSVFDNLLSEIFVTKNVTTDVFYIHLPIETETISFHITNQIGQTVMDGKIGQSKNEVCISQLKSGIYFLTLSYRNRNNCTKIIKL